MTGTHSEIAVIGGGHNGLVAATYLARAGYRVSIFEARSELGGAVASKEVFEGVAARLSRFSYLVSLLPTLDHRGAGTPPGAALASSQVLYPGRLSWPPH